MYPIFVTNFSGVTNLRGFEIPVFSLTLLVIVTTVPRHRAACDTPKLDGWQISTRKPSLRQVKSSQVKSSQVYFFNSRIK